MPLDSDLEKGPSFFLRPLGCLLSVIIYAPLALMMMFFASPDGGLSRSARTVIGVVALISLVGMAVFWGLALGQMINRRKAKSLEGATREQLNKGGTVVTRPGEYFCSKCNLALDQIVVSPKGYRGMTFVCDKGHALAKISSISFGKSYLIGFFATFMIFLGAGICTLILDNYSHSLAVMLAGLTFLVFFAVLVYTAVLGRKYSNQQYPNSLLAKANYAVAVGAISMFVVTILIMFFRGDLTTLK